MYRDTVEVESIASLATGLVDGTEEPDHHSFTLTLQTPRLPQEHAAHTASHLRQQLGGGDLEIEWAWNGKQIQIIQARPLTVAPPAPRFSHRSSQRPVLHVSPLYGETPPEREFPVGQLDDIIDHYRRKRHRLYAVATDYGCSLGSALVLRFNHRGTVGDAWASIEDQLGETTLLDISPSERQRIIPTSQLRVALRDLRGDDPNTLMTVVVREFITGRGDALSSVLADSGVRIEYSRDGLLAINRGLAETRELTVYEGQHADPQLIPTGWIPQIFSTFQQLPPAVMKIVLGRELARLRNLAGITQDDAASVLRCTQQKIAHIEAGSGVRALELDALLDKFGADQADRAYVRDLQGESNRRTKRGAFSTRFSQHLRLLVDMEPSCQSYCTYRAMVVPGLLQTEDYMRTLFQAWRPSPSAEQIDLDTANRRTRQRVLDNIDQRFWFILDEAALRRTAGRPVQHRVLHGPKPRLHHLRIPHHTRSQRRLP